MADPGFVVAAGDWFVFLDAGLVVIEEAERPPRWWEAPAAPHREVLPVHAATAQLVGRTLYISANGQQWAEVEAVEDLIAARDFCDEVRRLRWAALQPTPQAPPPVRPAPRPAPRPMPTGPTVGQQLAGLVGDLVARLREEIAQAPRRR